MDTVSILSNLISCLGYPEPNYFGTPTLTSKFFKISFFEESINLVVIDVYSAKERSWHGYYRKDYTPKTEFSKVVANVAFQLFQGISSDVLFEKLDQEQ